MSDTAAVLVRLTPEEVISRLKNSVPREKNFGRYDNQAQVVGGTWGRSFDLRIWRGFSSKHNSLYLKGVIEPAPEGSRIHTWMGFHLTTKIFMTFWFLIIGVVWLVALFKVLPSGFQPGIKLLFCVPPPIMALMNGLALVSMRTRSKGDEGALKTFIEELFTDVKMPGPELRAH